jgi:hypothetical protein
LSVSRCPWALETSANSGTLARDTMVDRARGASVFVLFRT